MLISAMNGDAAATAAAESTDIPADPGTGETPADPGAGTEIPSEPVVDNVTAELDGYMALVESLLSDGGFNVTNDRDEIEEEYYIEGIMIVDGAEYPIRGERSSESEPGESEEETEFIVTLSSTRRMVVEQSVETEDGEHEREYNYVIYEPRSR